jgi:hypothetical protein
MSTETLDILFWIFISISIVASTAVVVLKTARRFDDISWLPRWLHAGLAAVLGYAWNPCPKCGRWFGGHEWDGFDPRANLPVPREPGRFRAICPHCVRVNALECSCSRTETDAWCRTHGREGCCGACDGRGHDISAPETGGLCWDCRGTGHPHLGPCTPLLRELEKPA